MTNGNFKDKYVQLNVVPNSGKTDQQIVSEPLVHEIAMATPHETGLTAPPNERHIPVYAQEPSHVTTYQYPSSDVMPN